MATVYVTPNPAGFTDYYGEAWSRLGGSVAGAVTAETVTTTTVDGIDLAITTLALHRSSRSGANVIVETSADLAHTWGAVTVATDAAADAAPSLFADRADRLYCWYHTSSAAKCYVSKDAGRTWALLATVSGVKWPVCVVTSTGQLLAGIASGNLTVGRSLDFWQTAPTSILSLAESDQIPALRLDRTDRPILLYQAGADVARRMGTRDLRGFGSATTLLSGRTLPALAVGTLGAVLFAWNGATLQTQRTQEDWQTLAGSLASAAGGLSAAKVGAAVDRADRIWYTGKASGGGFLTWRAKRYESGFGAMT